MADPQYYRLELDDVSTPAFTSFGKFYYGTMDEIKGFIDALDAADYTGDYSKDLVRAFDAYLQGHTNVTHSVAYHEVPLIKLVRLPCGKRTAQRKSRTFHPCLDIEIAP